MSELDEASSRVMERLTKAVGPGPEPIDSEKLTRWLDRELDGDGVPVRATLSTWWDILGILAQARDKRSGWPPEADERLLSLLRMVLRFSRPDGGVATLPADKADCDRHRASLRTLARAYPKAPEVRVIRWWLAMPDTQPIAPPLPAWSSPRQALAILRSSWLTKEDLLAIDQRSPSGTTALELVGRGCPWLQGAWSVSLPSGAASSPRPTHWHSSSAADLAEWSWRSGGVRVTRQALLFRGRRLALLSDQIDSAPSEVPWTASLRLAPGVAATRLEDNRGLELRHPAQRFSAQVLPIALPSKPYETVRGELQALSEGAVSLRQAPAGKRCWLPLLVSWDASRHRKRLHWRTLTITQEGRPCPPDVAAAVRVSWGREETYVFYRSLAPSALRAFLGHQTVARFLVGRFTTDGTVEPLVSID